MDLILIIILASIVLLLLIAALWWTATISFIPDPQRDSIKETLERILTECGYSGDLDIRRYSSTYTLDRKTIYLSFKDSDNESLLRRAIHELAHRFNRDSSEHGSMFQVLEKQFLDTAKKLKLQIKEIPNINRDCLTLIRSFREESEEKANESRIKYSFSFNPKII